MDRLQGIKKTEIKFGPLLQLVYLLVALFLFKAASAQDVPAPANATIATGQMPALTKDDSNTIHMVYGSGDTIMYTSSTDKGTTFLPPTKLAILPGLVAGATRGPQIAASKNELIVIACNEGGDIFSYHGGGAGKWTGAKRINDRDTVAKEGFIALSADGNNAFAVWLDLRDDGHNKLVGASSADAGKSWSANLILYASPDTTVCECCRPTVVMKRKNIYVMFRNWLNGSRDMYLIQSSDGGSRFGAAQKLGKNTWTLAGCPMDGGGLAVSNKGLPETVWQREGKIFAVTPGAVEKYLGEGRSCTMTSTSGKNVYAWTENGNVVCLLPGGLKKSLGQGKLPVLQPVDDAHLICVWQHENQIQRTVLDL